VIENTMDAAAFDKAAAELIQDEHAIVLSRDRLRRPRAFGQYDVAVARVLQGCPYLAPSSEGKKAQHGRFR
jgi:hypothetical protein